jgi:3-hydroxyisobutyrate dehydrogenase-like beta-hydroxyacid dehydrogenase
MRVGILGTGKMGGAIAKRLAASGHDVVVWNRTRSRAEALGVGKVTATPAEAAREADFVISILTDADAVRAAYLGDGGAAKAARNQVFVEMSTAGPDIVKEIAPAVERPGAKFVESPVMGSIGAMESGQGILFVAGDKDAIERARPVLEALGELRLLSDPASAASMKLVANTMLAGVSALAAELLAAGAAAGLDQEEMFSVLSRFAPVLLARKDGFVHHRYEPVTFALRDALKDLKLATEVYRRAGAATPLATATKELYEQAARSAGDLDLSAIATAYEKESAALRSIPRCDGPARSPRG